MCKRCGNPNPAYLTYGLGSPPYCDYCLFPYTEWLETQVERLQAIKNACAEWDTSRAPSTKWQPREQI